MGLMEPFWVRSELESFKVRLGLNYAMANVNGEIWAFVYKTMEVEVINGSWGYK